MIRHRRPRVDLLESWTLLASTLLSDLANISGLAYFAASDGGAGTNLMKSDGTPGGTSVVAHLPIGRPLDLINVGEKPVFHVGDTVSTVDPATGRLVTIADYDGHDDGRYPYQFTIAGNRLFYLIFHDGNASNISLDVTDGTPGGTTRLFNGPNVHADGSL